MPEIEIAADPDALADLVPAWEDLWRRDPAATPFQHPAWLLPWWRHFPGRALRVVAAREDGRLVGLLPLYVLEEPGVTKLLPIGAGTSDYLDALVEAGPRRAAIAARLLDGVAAGADDWDVFDMIELRPGAALAEATVPPTLTEARSAGAVCPTLALPASPAALRDGLSGHMARNLRQNLNRAKRLGDVAFVTADPGTFAGLLDALVAIHGARWERNGEPGVFADTRVPAFHAEAGPLLLRAGLLRFHALTIDGRVAACLYGFVERGRAYAYLTGYDPAFAAASAGSLILAHAIEAAVAEGCREFHFLRGGEAHKANWKPEDRVNGTRHFRRRRALAA